MENTVLKLISGSEVITIDAVDASETVEKADDVFKSGINSSFKNWGIENWPIVAKSAVTGEMPVEVYDLAKYGTHPQMFGFLGNDLDELCFSQGQIKGFCKKHPKWFLPDGQIFFLFKGEGQFFVAEVRVHVRSGALHFYTHRLGSGNGWGSGTRSRVVVPQLPV